MIRFELMAILLASLLFAVLSVSFSGTTHRTATPFSSITVTTATSSIAVPSLVGLPSLTLEEPVATTTPPAKSRAPTMPAHHAVVATPAPAPVPIPVLTIPLLVAQSALDASASALRGALVNILCSAPAGSRIHSISASGIMVGAQGYILTNAHVAQYFLLADQGVSCAIRTGDPATTAYRAKLAFIPAPWVRDNATVLTQAAPSGTGERDFAILAITGSATQAPLPIFFPTVPLSFSVPASGTPVVIASYGAQFLQSSEIQTALSPTIVFGSVVKLFTFGTNTADVLSLGGSAAAQEGSSGGGVADALGELVGDITTSTIEGDTSTRTLSAITASYIRREYTAETGETLELLFTRSPAVAVATFAPTVPGLEAILLDVLAH